MKKSHKLNLHLLHNNLILSYLYTVNIAQFISIAVHKEIVFLFIKVHVLDSYRLNFCCRNFATMICSSCTLFCFTFCFFSIYSFNNFSHANKKASSIQSTLHASANRQISFTRPLLVLLGLKLLAFK